MTDPNVIVSKELISKPQQVARPKYKYLKLYPTRGSSNLAIPYTSTTQVQFEIPTRNINYSKSMLCGQITRPHALGIGHVIVSDSIGLCSAARFNMRTGANIFDIEYLQNYVKLVNRYDKTIEEVMSNNNIGRSAIYSSRNISESNYFDKRPVLVAGNESIKHLGVEAQYVDGGRLGAAGPPVVSSLFIHSFGYSLSDLAPHTIFAKKHDIKFPEIGVLTLRMGPGNRYTWTTTSDTDPTAGVADPAANIEITDFHILLAVQDDNILEQMMNDKMRVGYTIPLNSVIYTMNALGTASQNVSVTYNSGHGKRLKKIYHSVFNDTETRNTSCDNSGRKVLNYHVKINSSRTTETDLSTDPNDITCLSAYTYHKPLLEGTTVTNDNIYNYNFVHIEDVGRLGSPAEQLRQGVRGEDVIAGERLDQDYKFEFTATTAAATHKHYTFAIVQRDMFINESSVVIS